MMGEGLRQEDSLKALVGCLRGIGWNAIYLEEVGGKEARIVNLGEIRDFGD